MSRRTISLAALTALLALAWAAAPAYAIDLTPPEPHSPNADAIHSSYVVMLVVTVIIAVIVNGALIAAVVRFRERRGVEPARFTAGRGAFRPVLAVLGLMAIAIFVFGVVKTNDARSVEPSGPDGLGGGQTAQVGVKGLPPVSILTEQSATGDQAASGSAPTDTSPLQINAIAQQWLWRFEYPGGRPGERTFSYGELVVPVDTPVILNISSTDVLHSWWVPALGGQVQASPGEVVQTWFKADEVGRYAGASTVYSGTSFPAMRAWVRVVTVPEYQAYIERLGQDLKKSQDIIFQAQKSQDSQ
ncbi:MAG: cytochrome c oxidase subunit [Solirubrobacterales bacterium]|nr:cytochrome c oxidase subunit [Solirubrobacterales bacterium]